MLALQRREAVMAAKKKVAVVLSDPQPKKHVVRYDCAADDAALSSIYVSKAAIEELGNPSSIKVMIEAV
jgi:hypothetical protein